MKKVNILPKFVVDMKTVEEPKKINPKKVFEQQPAKPKPKPKSIKSKGK